VLSQRPWPAALTALVLLSVVACERPNTTEATGTGVADAAVRLSGPFVVRFPPNPSDVERERVLVRGERTRRGCRYPSGPIRLGLGESHAEWVVEYNPLTCTAVHARGTMVGELSHEGEVLGDTWTTTLPPDSAAADPAPFRAVPP
jgi:hypothetical protein